MSEHDIIESIDELVREERELRSRARGKGSRTRRAPA